MRKTNVRMFEIHYFDINDKHDNFVKFLNLSENILLSFKKREELLAREIEWINDNFITVINEISLLRKGNKKDALLKMAISEMEIINKFDDYNDDKAYNFIELIINLKNKIDRINNMWSFNNFMLSNKFEEYNNHERAVV
ncbi:hypothetical protein AB6E71_10400 [Staphylococcus arlettae]|uniref:hypothetical protein n=1 Tax=Staphylococcus TaxID=1279 RepID=UPI00194FBBA1|nr:MULTISPECIES: hypothetical protein [Staphylococcus]MDT3924460.1 hypothetical protein [Staphylococcus saprophyticus]